MSSLAVFKFDDTTSIRTDVIDGDVWFVAKDIASALAYTRTGDALEHCKNSNNAKTPQLNKINDLPPATKWIPESDVFRLVMKSTKKEAEKFQDWVVEDVLPTIRKTGSYTYPAANDPTMKEKLELDLMFAESVTKTLRLPQSGTLSILSKLEAKYNLTPVLPAYAVDAPDGDIGSRPTNSATKLLADNKTGITTQVFNKLAIAEGYLEKLTRPSTSKGTKEFLSITEKGAKYGKNLTSKHNQRETQPHWYVSTFTELTTLLLGE